MNSCEDWDDVRYGSLVGLLRAKFSQVIDLSNDCSNHDGFCIENGGFCIENDGFSQHADLAAQLVSMNIQHFSIKRRVFYDTGDDV